MAATPSFKSIIQHDSIQLWLLKNVETAIAFLGGPTVDLAAMHRDWLEDCLETVTLQKKQQLQNLMCDQRLSNNKAPEIQAEIARLEQLGKGCRKLIDELPVHWIEPISLTVQQKRSEHLVQNGRYPVGAVGLFAETGGTVPHLGNFGGDSMAGWRTALASDAPVLAPSYRALIQENYYFEVEAKIPSFSALVRKLRKYEPFLPRDPPNCRKWRRFDDGTRINSHLGVVSPDSAFAKAIREEGFFFIPLRTDPANSNGWLIEEKP